MSKILIFLVVLFLLVGCSTKDIKPFDIYTLSDSSKVDQSLHIEKVLKITKIKSSAYMYSDKIWYKESSVKIDSYFYSKWNSPFTVMIEQNLLNSISRSGLFKSTYARYSKVRSDLTLESEMIEAVQDVQKGTVKFGIRVYLVNQKSSNLISSKEFIYEEKCSSIDAKGAVKAYENITKKLNKDVILWLSKSMKKD
ncbi:MAG: hypothetical protein DRG78_10180 [Epsilonproteobacteria bacterium]|nr:MAG: hypothetical protein DRG78_10180 [Campylobacterota bacterium]